MGKYYVKEVDYLQKGKLYPHRVVLDMGKFEDEFS
jgi:hypothetical protein